MKKIMILLIQILVLADVCAVSPMKPLLVVDGEQVYLNEYLLYCSTSNIRPEAVKEHLDDFLLFKLKVSQARAEGYDTLPEFKEQLDFLKSRYLRSVIAEKHKVDELCRQRLQSETELHQNHGWARFELLTYPLPQHITPSDEDKAKRKMNEIYERAVKDSCKSLSCFASELRYDQFKSFNPIDNFINEIKQVLIETRVGGISKVIFSPVGFHIIKIQGKVNRINCEDLEWMSCYRKAIESRVVTDEEIAFYMEHPEKLDVDSNLRLKQIYDGLMCQFIENMHSDFMSTGKIEESELAEYFQQNKKKYHWDLPHYKGAVIHCQNKREAKRIKREIRRLPMEEWHDRVEGMQQSGEIGKANVESGLFCIGENSYIDHYVFKCGEMKADVAYPYMFIKGDILKKGPEEYQDMEKEVRADYKDYLQKLQIEKMKRKFKVKINSDVLASWNA